MYKEATFHVFDRYYIKIEAIWFLKISKSINESQNDKLIPWYLSTMVVILIYIASWLNIFKNLICIYQINILNKYTKKLYREGFHVQLKFLFIILKCKKLA